MYKGSGAIFFDARARHLANVHTSLRVRDESVLIKAGRRASVSQPPMEPRHSKRRVTRRHGVAKGAVIERDRRNETAGDKERKERRGEEKTRGEEGARKREFVVSAKGRFEGGMFSF